MGVTKTITQEGSGATPVKGDTVTMVYTGRLQLPNQKKKSMANIGIITGYLKDTSKPDKKGFKCDGLYQETNNLADCGI